MAEVIKVMGNMIQNVLLSALVCAGLTYVRLNDLTSI